MLYATKEDVNAGMSDIKQWLARIDQKLDAVILKDKNQTGLVSTLYMEDILQSPITWIIVAAASEIVGESKLKSNSVIRPIFQLIMQLKPKNKK